MTILVVIDKGGSAQAITTAYDLATVYDDTLIALHVIPEEEFEQHRRAVEESAEYRGFTLDQEAESAERFARRAVESAIDDADARVEFRGLVGDPAEQILTEIDRLDPRYLVIGGKRRSPVGKALFGSTLQHVLLNADCAVVTTLTD